MSEERLDRIDARLDRLEQGQDALRADVDGLRTDVDGLRTDVGDLRRHMGVLHEEVLDRIQTLAFDPAPLRREFRAGDAALREELTQRIEPLEAATRRRRRR
jgi:chromosome segregation ATPase